MNILVAHEYEVVREGLRFHLEMQSNWTVVAQASSGPEAIETAVKTKPDVVVTAYELPQIDGIEVTRQIRAQVPSCEVLVYTAYQVDSITTHLLEAGALGVVLKSEPMSRVIEGVQHVASRKPYFSGTLPAEKLQGSASVLTPREITILRLICEGQTNKMIARMLGISARTVETHRVNIMEKLSASSVAHLIRYAVRNGITTD